MSSTEFKEIKIDAAYCPVSKCFLGTYTVPIDQDGIEFGGYLNALGSNFHPLVMDYRKFFLAAERVLFLFGSDGRYKGYKSLGFVDFKGKFIDAERLERLRPKFSFPDSDYYKSLSA